MQENDWHTGEGRYHTGHHPNRPPNAMDKTLYEKRFELRYATRVLEGMYRCGVRDRPSRVRRVAQRMAAHYGLMA
jgi:hypothetical protein